MNRRMSALQPPPSRQNGIVLVVGLVFLLVLTIIGVTSLRTTTLEQRMAGNMQQRTVAFQDAEARIAMLINDINSGAVELSPADDCTASPASNPGMLNDAITYHLSCREFVGSTDQARRTDTAFGGQTSLFHFRIRSESETAGNAEVNIQQGGAYEGGSEGQGVLRE